MNWKPDMECDVDRLTFGCVYCGQPCGFDEVDNDGNPIHEQCAIDRMAAMMDRGKDERMGTD